jgi:hypothetical protein
VSHNLPPVPFHSQHWDLSKWHELGFQSYEDAEYWMVSCCGILCIQMAAEYFLQKKFRTDKLITQGKELRAYTHEHGWSHAGLVELIKSLGLRAKACECTPNQIADATEDGSLIIVSITPGFEPLKKNLRQKLLFWRKYGGHLALVIDDEQTKEGLQGFYVHHTSKRENYNWAGKFIPLKEFEAGYTGRAIVISK